MSVTIPVTTPLKRVDHHTDTQSPTTQQSATPKLHAASIINTNTSAACHHRQLHKPFSPTKTL
ncbi:hypothetical protein JD969_12935 [Planctomycetota bacterium]|nr:hypothetical protein JD969_12935 [Planctomycetota bacterium]